MSSESFPGCEDSLSLLYQVCCEHQQIPDVCPTSKKRKSGVVENVLGDCIPKKQRLFDGQGNEVFLVEELLSKQTRVVNKKPKVFYLVKWRGYSDQENTWEPYENLRHLDILLSAYEASPRFIGIDQDPSLSSPKDPFLWKWLHTNQVWIRPVHEKNGISRLFVDGFDDLSFRVKQCKDKELYIFLSDLLCPFGPKAEGTIKQSLNIVDDLLPFCSLFSLLKNKSLEKQNPWFAKWARSQLYKYLLSVKKSNQ